MIGMIFLGMCNFVVGTVSLTDAIKKDEFNLSRLIDLFLAALNYAFAIIVIGLVLQKLNLI